MSFFNKIYLDPFHLASLENQGMREGWIREASDPREDLPDVMPRNALRRQTLVLLTLFKNFDSLYSRLDMSRFIHEGLAEPTAWLTAPEKKIPQFDSGTKNLFWASDYTMNETEAATRENAWNTAEQLLARLKDKLLRRFLIQRRHISTHLNMLFPMCAPRLGEFEKLDHDTLDATPSSPYHFPVGLKMEYHTAIDRIKKYKHLKDDYGYYAANFQRVFDLVVDERKTWGLDQCPNYFEIEIEEPYLAALYVYLSHVWMSLSASMFFASQDSSAMSNSLGSIDAEVESGSTIQDTYYFVKTKIPEAINVLPAPESLKDVAQLRQRPELERFREVFEEWMIAVRAGDSQGVKNITRDLAIANRCLKTLNRWREYEESPFHFWIVSIGGHIPILSNILTGVFTLSRLIGDSVTSKYGWVNLSQTVEEG